MPHATLEQVLSEENQVQILEEMQKQISEENQVQMTESQLKDLLILTDLILPKELDLLKEIPT